MRSDMGDRSQNLLFLLSLAPLAAGCPGDDSGGDGTTGSMPMTDDSTSGSPTTTPPPTTMTSADSTGTDPSTTTDPTDPTTDTMPMTDSGATDSGATDSGATDSGATDSGATDSGGSDSGSSDSGNMDTPCQQYGNQLSYCYYGNDPTYAANAAAGCDMAQAYLAATYGAACSTALEEFAACLGALPCAQWANIGDGACDTEQATFQTECSPPPGACPDQDAGNTVPQTINGDTTGLGGNHAPSCGAGGGEDATIQFTAPADGTYIFDTSGSAFDTVLALLDACGGNELDCNDDEPSGMSLSSELTLAMTMGQTVIVVVDSFDGEVGPFTLNITQQ